MTEEIWALAKKYGELAAFVFGLGVMWTNLRRDRDMLMEKHEDLEKQIATMHDACEEHRRACPASIHLEMKGITSLVAKTATDVAYIRGQIDGIKKRQDQHLGPTGLHE